MCIFSQSAEVFHTEIFARSSQNGGQYLAYSMEMIGQEEMAMILPIPVLPSSPEEAVRWIDLEWFPFFFEDLNRVHDEDREARLSIPSTGGSDTQKTLVVTEVGQFEASFVPTLNDFNRLDERFKLPIQIWEQLPQYAHYGFAVIKLNPRNQGFRLTHPIAFEFPRADPTRLFFPTMHIHDGQVAKRAHFHHALHCQKNDTDRFNTWRWDRSRYRAGVMVDEDQGVVDMNAFCYRVKMRGLHENRDIWLS